MRLTKPNSSVAGGVLETLSQLAWELLAILREVVRIPAGWFMRVAELAGVAVLAAWRVVWPLIEALAVAGLRVLEALERALTPARATVAVAALVALALAASQFADYRAVAVGAPDYSAVESVAPAPPVDRETTGSAHLWLGLPLAALALAIVARAAAGRWRAARLLIAVGVAVIALSLAVDMPQGLDEGQAAVAYEGANAELLGGFWAQLVCGAVLVVLGPLLSRALEPGARAAAESGARRVQPLRLPSLGARRLPALPRRPQRPARVARVSQEAGSR